MSAIDPFIKGLPKAELHMHIEGSIEPELMFALSERNGIPLKWNSVDEVRAAYRFQNLQEFLNLYYDGCRVLLNEQDFYDMTRAYLKRAHEDHVLRAEMFMGPQAHTRRGIAMDVVMNGTLAAMRDAEREDGISSGLLIGTQRHLPEADALQMMEDVMPWADRIAGFGLGGAEVGNPPSKFERYFAACRERGFKVTAHAGEEGPADYVRQSVELLRVDRIDHGNACLDDDELVASLVDSQIPLTVCPLSNLALQVVKTLPEHPIKTMLDKGLCATMNSDDPSFFGGYVNRNFQDCTDALGLSRAHLVQLARNSLQASFVPDVVRSDYLQRLDAYVRDWDARDPALVD